MAIVHFGDAGESECYAIVQSILMGVHRLMPFMSFMPRIPRKLGFETLFIVFALVNAFALVSPFARAEDAVVPDPALDPDPESIKDLDNAEKRPATQTDENVFDVEDEKLAPNEELPTTPESALEDGAVPQDNSFRMGLSALAGTPHDIGFSLDSRIDKKLGGSFALGAFRTNKNGMEFATSFFDVYGRWFFSRWYFAGLGLGQQTVTGEDDETIEGIKTHFRISRKATYIRPHGGCHWVSNDGLLLGVELGLHLTVATSDGSESARMDDAESAVEDAAANSDAFRAAKKTIGDKVSDEAGGTKPFAAVRIGWMF